jgi:hypothetical protein
MKYHPYSEIWPLMEGADFDKLTADIKANGQRHSITTYKGMVLDGRNRERACEAAGIAPWYLDAGDITEQQALELVVSLNDHRRHMSAEQRAFAAERLANIHTASNQYLIKKEVIPVGMTTFSPANVSMDYAAKALGTSIQAIARARVIRRKGTAEDMADVLNRKASLSGKAEEVRARTKKSAPLKNLRTSSGRVLRFHNTPPIPRLTQQEVDPDFTGTPMEFTTKYGHVQIHTAEEYARMYFGDWASIMKGLVTEYKRLPKAQRPVDHNWLRSPTPRDVTKLREALECLRPVMVEAEALLITAEAALAGSAKAVGEKS